MLIGEMSLDGNDSESSEESSENEELLEDFDTRELEYDQAQGPDAQNHAGLNVLGWRESPRIVAQAFFPARAQRTRIARRHLIETRARAARKRFAAQQSQLRQALLWEMIRRQGHGEDQDDEENSDEDFAGGTPGGEGDDFELELDAASERVETALWTLTDRKPLDILAPFGDLCVYQKNGADVLLKLFARDFNLDKDHDGQGVVQRCVELWWRESGGGGKGSNSRKRVLEQMLQPESRLVVAFDKASSGNAPVAFICFAFSVEQGDQVSEQQFETSKSDSEDDTSRTDHAALSILGMHLEQRVRGKGLGSHLVKLVSKIASFHQMDYLATSVPDATSRKFFQDQGFQADPQVQHRMIYRIRVATL